MFGISFSLKSLAVRMNVVGAGVKIAGAGQDNGKHEGAGAGVDVEVRTPDSGYSSVSSHSTRSFSNSLDVHAEELEPSPIPPTDSPPKRAASEVDVSRPSLETETVKKKAERKRTKSEHEDDKVVAKVSDQKTELAIPGVALRTLLPGVNTDLVDKARTMVERAVKQHKVFIIFGQYSSVRRALKRRGWLEKPCDCCRVPRYTTSSRHRSHLCPGGMIVVTQESTFFKTVNTIDLLHLIDSLPFKLTVAGANYLYPSNENLDKCIIITFLELLPMPKSSVMYLEAQSKQTKLTVWI